jgi:hypothetical protein
MEVRTETKVVSVTLTMEPAEAKWLMDVMQNPFCSDCGRESKDTERMRELFFYAMKGETEEKYEEAKERREAPKRELRPCFCGESDPYKLMLVCQMASGPYNCPQEVGYKLYEHFVKCSTCGKEGPKIYGRYTDMPQGTLEAWGLK